MRSWLSFLVTGRVLELALALGVGYATWNLADGIADAAVHIIAQHVGRDPSGEDGTVLGLLDLFQSPYYLNFSIGGTVMVYGGVLSATLGLGFVASVGVFIIRRRDRELGICPHCESRIPYGSTHCAYCGSAVAPGEP